MDLSVCIKNLLYRYDCVIVPGFGGFVTNFVSSKIVDGIIYPPRKNVAFNVFLQHNDGLLINYVAREQKWNYQKALENIEIQVNIWKQQLKIKPLFLEDIGELCLNKEQNIVFSPNKKINYRIDSFGLTPYSVKKFVNPLQSFQKPVTYSINLKQTLKYVAGFVLVFAIGSVIYQNNAIFLSTKTTDNPISTIQSASFVEKKTKEKIPTSSIVKNLAKNYYVVLGAFQKRKNAFRKKRNLARKSFKARILSKNEKGLFIVAMGKYHSKAKAKQMLRSIRRQLQKDAWLLVK